MNESFSCGCGSAPAMIFPCSGAADTGVVADRAGRKLSAEGAGKLACLAWIGGRVSGIMKSAEAASVLLANDSCPSDCAKKTLEFAGFKNIQHIRVTAMGFVKGKTPSTKENIGKVVEKGREILKGFTSEERGGAC